MPVKTKSRKSKSRIQVVTANVRGAVKQAEMGGRKYLVAKMVMLTEGVHQGNNGPLYYPHRELGDLPERWNHKPVVINHPVGDDGESVSACTPRSVTKYGVGVIMNTHYDEGSRKLRAEAWLEEDRLREIAPQVYRAIRNGKIIEVSTGLFSDNRDRRGTWNGEKYVGVARNFKPDHLAILTEGRGACSVADGAGLLQVNREMDRPDLVVLNGNLYKMPRLKKKRVANRQSAASASSSGLKGKKKMPLTARAKEIRNAKKKLIAKIVANKEGPWDKDDADLLMQFKVSKLKKLATNSEEPKEEKEEVAEEKSEKKVTKKTVTAETEETQEQEEAPEKKVTKNKRTKIRLEDLPDEVKEVITNAKRIVNAEKTRYIKTILANKDNVFSEDQLKGMTSDQLKGIASLARKSEAALEDDDFNLDFSGQGISANAEDDDDFEDEEEEEYTPPSTFDINAYNKK